MALDSDYTLFQTYNGTQSVLSTVLSAESTVVEIVTAKDNDQDNWPSNGFATIDDELIYYDAVERDYYGRINKLTRCIRALEGDLKEHRAGSPLYGNVVAQHHNQLVEAILRLESLVGTITGDLEEVNTVPIPTKFAPDKIGITMPDQFGFAEVDLAFSKSLGLSLDRLLSFGTNWNDACPDVDFVFNTISTTDGIVGEYCVKIYGEFTNYLLDFGDGESTTDFAGSHLYTGPVDPVVSVTSADCTVVMQPLTPTPGCVSPSITPTPYSFHIPIPSSVEFPSFTAPKLTCPGPLFSFPPIGSSCMDMSSICSCFPSVFSHIVRISGCCLPSVISVVGCCPPSRISYVGCCPPSFISFIGCCQPSVISFVGPRQPSVISFVGCCQPSVISFVGIRQPSVISFVGIHQPSVISFAGCCQPSVISVVGLQLPSTISVIGPPPISFAPFPHMSCISFCTPPAFACVSFCTPPSFTTISFSTPPTISVDWRTPPTLSCIVTVACPVSSTSGSSSPMQGFAADFQDGFGMVEDIPVTLNDIGIPEEIRLVVPNIPDMKLIHDLPTELRLVHDLPTELRLVHDLHKEIKLNADDVPKSIPVDASSMPKVILVEPAPNFPTVIRLELDMPQSLQVTGFPKSIELVGPSFIQLVMPEDPVVRMVFDGAPLQLTLAPEVEKLLKNLAVVSPSN